MRFTLPAPRKGWGVFLGEVWIIVLGVLLALGAQQLVDWIQWRGDVADARAALKVELDHDLGVVAFTIDLAPCHARRLDEYDRWVQFAREGKPIAALPATPNAGWSIHSSVWDVVKTGQTAGRLPLEDKIAYAKVYDVLANLSQMMLQDREQRRTLRDIVGLRHPDDATLAKAEGLTAALRRLPLFYRSNLEEIGPEIARLGLHADQLADPRPADRAAFCAPTRV